MSPEIPDLRPERLDLRPKRLDLRPERLHLRPKRLDLRSEGPDDGGDKQTNKQTNAQTKVPLCSTGLRPLWGRCPKGISQGMNPRKPIRNAIVIIKVPDKLRHNRACTLQLVPCYTTPKHKPYHPPPGI